MRPRRRRVLRGVVVSFFRFVNKDGTVFGAEGAAAEGEDVAGRDGTVGRHLAVDERQVAQHLVEAQVHRLVHHVQLAEERVGLELVFDLLDLVVRCRDALQCLDFGTESRFGLFGSAKSKSAFPLNPKLIHSRFNLLDMILVYAISGREAQSP